MWRVVAILFLLASSSEAAAAVPLSAEDAAAIARASERGGFLAILDRAAWVGTDAVLASGWRPPQDADDAGYIVEAAGKRLLVTFYVGRKDRYAPGFLAEVEAGKVVASGVAPEGARLTDTQARMIRARKVAIARALKGDLMRCTEPMFNTVVIPPVSPDGPIDVYLLTAPTEDHRFPAGGHHLLTVDVAAGKTLSERPFSKSCLDLTPRGIPYEEAAFAAVTHLLDPTPTEIHVFTSIAMRLPIVVVTQEAETARGWDVEGVQIRPRDLD